MFSFILKILLTIKNLLHKVDHLIFFDFSTQYTSKISLIWLDNFFINIPMNFLYLPSDEADD